MKKNIFFLILLLLGYFPTEVFAGEIFFGAKGNEFGMGEKFEVGVFVDTQSQAINAIEGQISFPSDFLKFEELYTGNSIMNFWVKNPVLVSGDTVSFAGITPGGITGNQEYLFSLVFTPIKEGRVTISANQEKILLHDGAGSEAKITKAPLTVSIVGGRGQEFIPPEDKNPPERFSPEIGRDDALFEGKSFLVFATQDKSSGIDRYEVKEGIFGSFIVAESPHLIKNQKLNEKIFVKAIDKNGNERTEVFYPSHWQPWYKNYTLLILLVVAIIVVIGASVLLWKEFRS